MKILKTTFIALLLTITACSQEKGKQNTKIDYSNVDYSARSNIIKPDTLKGDEKTIFYHPYFLKLTSEQAENLDPFRVKEEFAKLGITIKDNDRFVDGYSFFDAFIVNHKISCEQWESFKDLAPKSKN